MTSTLFVYPLGQKETLLFYSQENDILYRIWLLNKKRKSLFKTRSECRNRQNRYNYQKQKSKSPGNPGHIHTKLMLAVCQKWLYYKCKTRPGNLKVQDGREYTGIPVGDALQKFLDFHDIPESFSPKFSQDFHQSTLRVRCNSQQQQDQALLEQELSLRSKIETLEPYAVPFIPPTKYGLTHFQICTIQKMKDEVVLVSLVHLR